MSIIKLLLYTSYDEHHLLRNHDMIGGILFLGVKMYHSFTPPSTAPQLSNYISAFILFILVGFMGHLLKGAYSSICRWFIDDYIPFIAKEYNWDWFGGHVEGFINSISEQAEILRNSNLDPSEQIIKLLLGIAKFLLDPFWAFLSTDLPNMIHEFFMLVMCLGSTPMKNYRRVWKIFAANRIRLLFNFSRLRAA
jgi:hypothetical protein